MPLWRVPRCNAFDNLNKLADDTVLRKHGGGDLALGAISESDSQEMEDCIGAVGTSSTLVVSEFGRGVEKPRRRRTGRTRRRLDVIHRGVSERRDETDSRSLAVSDSLREMEVTENNNNNCPFTNENSTFDHDSPACLHNEFAFRRRDNSPAFRYVQIEDMNNTCTSFPAALVDTPPAIAPPPIATPPIATPPIASNPEIIENKHLSVLRCRLCNEIFGSTLAIENHLISSSHKRQARCLSLIHEYMDERELLGSTSAEPSAGGDAKRRNSVNLQLVNYEVKQTHFIRTLNQLTAFCNDVQRTLFDLTYVGFDTEHIAVTKTTSCVVLMQICLSPYSVAIVAIREIVKERNGVFPDFLLNLLKRFILVGVKVTEDIHALVRTFDLTLDYTMPERAVHSAIRTLELNELGKMMFGPRCETGTWGLQSLYERIDPGFTILKDFNLRVSDWSKPLTEKQIRYAATDAAVSLFIFQDLVLKIHSKLFGENHACTNPHAYGCKSLTEKLDKIVETFVVI